MKKSKQPGSIFNWQHVLLYGFVFLGMLACNSQREAVVAPTDTPTSGTIHISVDESFRPVIEEQIKVYEGSYPGSKIIAHYKEEAACLKDLTDSATRMVIATRGLSAKEAKYFYDSLSFVPRSEKIASDAIAVVTSINAKDSVFSLEELKKLLTGKGQQNKKIVFDGFAATSSVRFALDSILKGQKFDLNKVKAAGTSKEVLNFVANDTAAIGFVGISWIGNPEDSAQVRQLKKVRIAYLRCELCQDSPFVKPTQAGMMSRRYPLVRGLYFILKENYSGLGSGFAAFLQYERGQLIFRRSYIWPAAMNFNIRNVKLNEKLKKD
jgi:phosphate transport system substrate-binding protein